MTTAPPRHDLHDADPKRLVVVSAGTGDPSSTRQLTDRIAQKTLARLRAAGTAASSSVIELGPLAVDIARATTAGFPNQQLQAAIDRLAAADAIIAATPVYKAGMSGLFKSHTTKSSSTRESKGAEDDSAGVVALDDGMRGDPGQLVRTRARRTVGETRETRSASRRRNQ